MMWVPHGLPPYWMLAPGISHPAGSAELTPHERRVVRLLSLGCTLREAAAVLREDAKDTQRTKRAAMAKIRTNNIARLTRYAILSGLSPLDDELTSVEARRCAAARK
jgi:DNA-binding CsgD family transcriptional regulator